MSTETARRQSVSAPVEAGLELRIGRAKFAVPRGSRVAHVSIGKGRLCWVLAPDGVTVVALTETGPVRDLPEAIARLVKHKIFGSTSQAQEAMS